MNITKKRFWVVRNPVCNSTVDDIVFEFDMGYFHNYVRGTNSETYELECHTCYDNEEEAFKDATKRIKKIKDKRYKQIKDKRYEQWKQETQKMQLNALLVALNGEISNIEDGIKVANAIDRSKVWLNQLKLLGDSYLKEEW